MNQLFFTALHDLGIKRKVRRSRGVRTIVNEGIKQLANNRNRDQIAKQAKKTAKSIFEARKKKKQLRRTERHIAAEKERKEKEKELFEEESEFEMPSGNDINVEDEFEKETNLDNENDMTSNSESDFEM